MPGFGWDSIASAAPMRRRWPTSTPSGRTSGPSTSWRCTVRAARPRPSTSFRRTRDVLVEELGVEPGPELQLMHRRILEQDEELDPWNRADTGTTAPEVALPRDNLRAEPNLFVERPEVGTVVDALHPGRVVTVVGAGGIGKSRCVAAVARRCLGTAPYADGVWIVDLAPLPEGSNEVAAAVAAALGLGQQRSRSTAETIVDYLDNRRALLVLDNCEHVATAAAAFADSVGAGSTTTAILAASRVRLAVRAESVITLERLPDDAAHRLLLARIAEVGAGPFADDECADLCAVLDNYPLAIELAAARTRARAPRDRPASRPPAAVAHQPGRDPSRCRESQLPVAGERARLVARPAVGDGT